MGRKAKDTEQIACRVPASARTLLAEDAAKLGYTGQGGKVLWGEYFTAIAVEILNGKINLPNRVDSNKR